MQGKRVNDNPYDIIGNRYNDLEVLSFEYQKDNEYYYRLKCKCGNEKILKRSSFISYQLQTCGCAKKDILINRNKTHGMSNTRFYRIYIAMKRRCYDKNASNYFRYGGRGIKVCDRWLGDNGFVHFKEDMYDSYLRKSKECGENNISIDRINVDGDYCQENCRWATTKEQANNTRTNRYIDYKGNTYTLSQLYDNFCIKEINIDTLRMRINNGWCIDKALTKPPSDSETYIFTYNNETLPLAELVRKYAHNGVKYGVAVDRIRRGLSIGQALETPLNKKQEYIFTYNGETLPLIQLIRKYKDSRLTESTVWKRVVKYNWDLNRALHELPHPNNGKYIISPISFKEPSLIKPFYFK